MCIVRYFIYYSSAKFLSMRNCQCYYLSYFPMEQAILTQLYFIIIIFSLLHVS